MKKTARAAIAVLSGTLAMGATAGTGATTASPSAHDTAPQTSAFMPGSGDAEQNKLARAQVKKALDFADKQGPAKTRNQYATTVYYSVSQAPLYASYIRQGAAIWNSSVSNVRLVENNSYATLDFYQGSGGGSHYSGDMHGSGYIYLDSAQMNVYSKVRIASHETGHALGLYDNYDGPCSELMSGGGQPPSCTNAYPNSAERSRVEALWANGFMASQGKTPNAAPKALATN